MWSELRLFGDHDGIDPLNRKMLFIEQSSCMFQKEQAARALPFRIRVRKMRADVAQSRRTQQRIAHRVRQHVTIRMPHRPLVKPYFDSADDERPPLGQPMQVVADSRPERAATHL